MNLKPLKKDFDQLTAKYHPPGCPRCQAWASLSDEELDELGAFLEGKTSTLSPELAAKEWPSPFPWCQRCSRD